MSLLQVIKEALGSLASNKLRSGLTMLGIIIGVAAVIALMAAGDGVQNQITDQITGIGTNLIYISSGNQQKDLRNIKPLTLSDAEALTDQLAAPSVLAVAPILSGNLEVSYGKEYSHVSITGITSAYAVVANEAVTEGDFISEEQITAKSAVAVIGTETAEDLFGRSIGVTGETIRIDGTSFRIIGVLESKGGSSFGSQDNRILVPLTTAQKRLFSRDDPNSVDSIQVQAIDSESVTSATEEVSEILRIRHRTKAGEDDFTLFTQDSILDIANSITSVLTIFLGGIAGISLLVGGIGIMNIMLVSVTERTREIGLRKAVGARKRDILVQFLTESVLLCLLGGLLGILLGWGLASLIGWIATISGAAIEPSITMSAVLLATLFSLAVGLIFGIYPANRAAGLQPVEALRFE